MQKVAPTPASTLERFEAICAELGAESGTMFGMKTLKAGGKAFAGVFGAALVFKLGGESHATALALAGATLFDPSGMGRPMKEWVVVPATHAAKWPALAEMAKAYVVPDTATKTKPAAKGRKTEPSSSKRR